MTDHPSDTHSKLTRTFENNIKEYIRGWLESGGIAEFIKAKGLETDTAIQEIMDMQNCKKTPSTRQPKVAAEAVTVEMLKAMLCDDFDDNWNDDGDHCIYFLGGRSAPRNGKTHVFCGLPGGIVCKEHIKPAEGKRIQSEHESGKLDLITHKTTCRKKRVKYAQDKLKVVSGTTTSSSNLNMLKKPNKKEFVLVDYELDRNLKYVEETGLIVKRSATDDRWIAVGCATSASSEIHKLSVNDMNALAQMEITAEDDALSDEARAYVENKRATQQSCRQTFTSSKPQDQANSAFTARVRRTATKPTNETPTSNAEIETVKADSPQTLRRMPNSSQRRTIQSTAKPIMPGDDN